MIGSASVAVQRECAACEREEEPVSRRATSDQTSATIPPIVGEVNHSGGRPLDARVRALFETGYGWNFANVRVHADDHAAEAARAVNARAYTSGNHIVFARGELDPASSSGNRLIAHELAHVIQQSGGAVSPGISRPNDASEREADRMANSITWGGASPLSLRGAPPTSDGTGMSGHTVQRLPNDGLEPPGDCTWAIYVPLRAAVTAASTLVIKLGGCKEGDDCPLIAIKMAALTAEIAARRTLAITCFRGGDNGHHKQINDKVIALNKCGVRFEDQDCGAKLKAAAAIAAATAAAVKAAEVAKAARAAAAAAELAEGAVVAGEVVEGGVTAFEVLEVIGLILVL